MYARVAAFEAAEASVDAMGADIPEDVRGGGSASRPTRSSTTNRPRATTSDSASLCGEGM